jgi:hypothetical protein
MVKAISLALASACILLAGNAYAQQGKAAPKKATPEQCAFLAEQIRQQKEGLEQLKASGLQGEELRKKQEPFEVFITLNEGLHERVCK